MGMEALDGDRADEPRWAEQTAEVYTRHTARADLVEYDVTRCGLPQLEPHSRRLAKMPRPTDEDQDAVLQRSKLAEPTKPVPQAATLALTAVDLFVIAGPGRGAHAEIRHGSARIGAAPSNELVVADPTVSRLHCRLTVSAEGVRVVDSSSKNGTLVDGVRIFDALVGSGSTLTLGTTQIRVEFRPEPAELQISSFDRFGDLVGVSPEMRRVFTLVDRVAKTDATVLLQGETGTGKELVARAIHEASPRAEGPFVVVDCGAMAEALMESELFGHARGAFTGATQDRIGLFEQARGGTLFLDEIGELPASLQPKLLRALEAREVRRVGTNMPRPVDVRVLAATNRDLGRSVNDGTFREDLYYRLAVVEIALPPLRVRRGDIPLLAALFYERFSGDAGLPSEWIPTLLARSWPGNVRELRNFVERSVSLGLEPAAGSLPRAAPPEAVDALVPTELPLREARAVWAERFEEVYVRALLRRTGGNVTRAAELAGVNRRTLQRMIASLGPRDAG